MKTIPLLLCVFSSLLTYAQPNIVWESEIAVADGDVYGFTRPRMEVREDGQVFVLLAKNGGGQLAVARGDGHTFNEPVIVTPEGVQTYLANWTGPDMSVHGDTVIVVFKAMPFDSGKIYAVRSTDGGLSFSDTLRVDSHEDGMAWMPSMDMDDAGNPIVTYMVHESDYSHPRYVYVSSNNGGESYNAQQDIAFNVQEEACDCCPAELAASGNRRVLTYRNNDANVRDIFAVYSDDGGQSFPHIANIDQFNWFLQSCPSTGPHPVIDDTTLYTAFASDGSGDYRSYVSVSSLNQGIEQLELYPLPFNTSDPNSVQNFPRISKQGDLFVAAWGESENNDNNVFTTFSESGDLNDLMNNKQIVNEQIVGYQHNPDIRIANGWIHIVWQDVQNKTVFYKKGGIGFAGMDGASQNKLSVYPNPAKSQGVIHVNHNLDEVFLSNLNGRVIPLSQSKNGKLDLPILAPGLYLLKGKNPYGYPSSIRILIQ